MNRSLYRGLPYIKSHVGRGVGWGERRDKSGDLAIRARRYRLFPRADKIKFMFYSRTFSKIVETRLTITTTLLEPIYTGPNKSSVSHFLT